MEWKSMKLPVGAKLFQVHNFTFMLAGNTYLLEIDEYADGTFAGHGEHSTDKSRVIESVSGKSVKSCLDSLAQRVASRETTSSSKS